MRKTITLPDGTVEVLEGTPEEIAAHEGLIRERSGAPSPRPKAKKKPEVLRGLEVVGTEPTGFDPPRPRSPSPDLWSAWPQLTYGMRLH